MRPGEKDGVNYHFIDEATFLACWNGRVPGARAGIRQSVWHLAAVGRAATGAGTDVILEIDWQGAQQVKRLLPDTRSIFIMPPSRETLEQRLNARGQDDASVIAARMAEAVEEMSHYVESDYLVVNKDFEQALEELQAIVTSQRLRTARQSQVLQPMLADLVG